MRTTELRFRTNTLVRRSANFDDSNRLPRRNACWLSMAKSRTCSEWVGISSKPDIIDYSETALSPNGARRLVPIEVRTRWDVVCLGTSWFAPT